MVPVVIAADARLRIIARGITIQAHAGAAEFRT